MKKLLIAGLFLFMVGNVLGAELGAGGGSGYPSVIDTDASVESSATIARADVPNDLADAIIKIQTELGVNPAGNFGTVNDRLTSAPCARAYLSDDQDDLVDNTPIKILLNTESFDVGNNFDTAGSSFTVSITGYYHILANVQLEATEMVALKQYGVLIFKNGSSFLDGFSHSGVAARELSLHISDIRYLTIGDEITLGAYSNSGNNNIDVDAGANSTFLSIRLVQ